MSTRCEDAVEVDRATPSPQSAHPESRAALPTADAIQAAALERARGGDLKAFRVLLLAHQSRVYSLAARMLASREDAQELTQDVFLALHRSLESIESAAHLRHWLHRTVCHRAIDRLRRRPSLQLLPLEAADTVEDATTHADPTIARVLRGLIEQLPATPRAVMLLRYQEDLDPSEIAQVLGVPLNSVKSHLRRSLSWMRRRCSQLQCIAGGRSR